MLIYVSEGEGSIVLSDRVYELKAGVLCFIASRCHHYTMPDEPECYCRSKVFFSDAVIERIEALIGKTVFKNSSAIYAFIPPKERDEVKKLFLGLGEDELCSYSGLLRLISFLQRYAQKQCKQPEGIIASTAAYVNTHIQEDISIDKLCRNAHMSKYHFCRRFKSITGQTVMEYILKTRLTRAADMLRTSELTIGDISDRCGFCSISYFCRVFKEWSGLSPLQYKKREITQGDRPLV